MFNMGPGVRTARAPRYGRGAKHIIVITTDRWTKGGASPMSSTKVNIARPGKGAINHIPGTFEEAVALAKAGRPSRAQLQAERQAALIREHPGEYRLALLDILGDEITDIAFTVVRESRQ
jgi:hypothetical protein